MPEAVRESRDHVGETPPVGVRLAVRPRPRRALDERLFCALPALMRLGGRLTFALPPGSRLRRSLLKRNVELSYAAQNRRDWEAVLIPYDARSELRNEPISEGGLSSAVVRIEYRGRDGALELLEDWLEPFDEVKFEPQELVDLGDGRLLVLSRIAARGRASGLEVSEPLAQLMRFRGGVIVRQQNWLGSWDDGLRAAGLRS